MKFVYRFLTLLFLCVLLNGWPWTVCASGADEVEIPADFELSQKDHCSGHSYFHQAAANSDGMFLVCAHYIEPVSEDTYKRQYIDLYDTDGVFIKEFSFCTSQTYAAELMDSHIYLYFYGYCISIDWKTGEHHCYDQPDIYINENDALDHLRQKTFSAGQWQYICKRSFSGYTQLTRDNGDDHQVVINYSGLGLEYVLCIVGGVVAGITFIVIVILTRRRMKA